MSDENRPLGDDEVVEAEVVDEQHPSAGDEQNGNATADQVEQDLDELGEAKRERDEYLELAQRTKADFENYRRRVARETSEALARGKADLARQLLPALDNLERALEAGDDARSRDSARPLRESHEGLVKGVAMVRDELRSRLESAGVESFDAHDGRVTGSARGHTADGHRHELDVGLEEHLHPRLAGLCAERRGRVVRSHWREVRPAGARGHLHQARGGH